MALTAYRAAPSVERIPEPLPQPRLILWSVTSAHRSVMHVVLPEVKRRFWFNKPAKPIIVVGQGVHWRHAKIVYFYTGITYTSLEPKIKSSLAIVLADLWKNRTQETKYVKEE